MRFLRRRRVHGIIDQLPIAAYFARVTAEPVRERVALVTGGNRGIGLEVCRGLAELGLTVALGSRDPAAGAEAAAELARAGRRVTPVRLDVTDAESAREVVAEVQAAFGRVDVLINNAGVYLDEGVPGLAVDMDVVRRTLDTNLLGALRLCQAVVPGMRDRRYGRIVNVSSGYGALKEMDEGGLLAYKLSKLALNGLTRILAAELGGTGVLVNAMCPGWVRTRMGGRSAPRTPRQGADTALHLATLPADGPTGGFFRNRRPIPW
jgi:NAD(P)-dependent dehydrogenase (short-subunit alcohol dehydrogenase family)